MEDKIQKDKGWNFKPKINQNSRRIASDKKTQSNSAVKTAHGPLS